MKRILSTFYIGLGIVASGYLAMTGQRLYHNYKRKRGTVNTFAICNVETGMAIRVYNAGIPDETKIISYKHANWECMTWQMIKLADGSCLLKNLYTHKTFQPVSSPEPGVALWQQPLEANDLQYWEFVKTPDESYRIRLKGTELYITASGNKNNAPLVLMPIQDSQSQQWKLVEQHPIV